MPSRLSTKGVKKFRTMSTKNMTSMLPSRNVHPIPRSMLKARLVGIISMFHKTRASTSKSQTASGRRTLCRGRRPRRPRRVGIWRCSASAETNKGGRVSTSFNAFDSIFCLVRRPHRIVYRGHVHRVFHGQCSGVSFNHQLPSVLRCRRDSQSRNRIFVSSTFTYLVLDFVETDYLSAAS